MSCTQDYEIVVVSQVLIPSPQSRLVTAFIQVASGDQRADLSVGDTTLEHPESAVGIDVFDPLPTQYPLRTLKQTRDRFGRFDFSRLDVDHPQSQADLWPQVTEGRQFIGSPVGCF